MSRDFLFLDDDPFAETDFPIACPPLAAPHRRRPRSHPLGPERQPAAPHRTARRHRAATQRTRGGVMDKRDAKRRAHRWMTDVIEGALGNGDGDHFETDNLADYTRVLAAVREIQSEHERKARGA